MENAWFDACFVGEINNEPRSARNTEMIYAYEGKMIITVGNESAALGKGQVCIIRPTAVYTVDQANGRYGRISIDVHTLGISSAFSDAVYACFAESDEREYIIVESAEATGLIRRIINENSEYSLKTEGMLTELIGALMELREMKDISARESGIMLKASAYIDRHYSEPLEAAVIAERYGVSYSNFAKMFKMYFGRSCKEYLNDVRIAHAEKLIMLTEKDINEIAEECGFFDSSHFIRTYKKRKRTTPKRSRSGKK